MKEINSKKKTLSLIINTIHIHHLFGLYLPEIFVIIFILWFNAYLKMLT